MLPVRRSRGHRIVTFILQSQWWKQKRLMTIAQQKYLRHGVKYLWCLGTLDESSVLDRAIL